MRHRKRKYLTSTIVEPFPLFYAHVSYPEERNRATAKGPFYAAGSKTYHLDQPGTRAWLEWCVAGLREGGWTMIIGEEWR